MALEKDVHGRLIRAAEWAEAQGEGYEATSPVLRDLARHVSDGTLTLPDMPGLVGNDGAWTSTIVYLGHKGIDVWAMSDKAAPQ